LDQAGSGSGVWRREPAPEERAEVTRFLGEEPPVSCLIAAEDRAIRQGRFSRRGRADVR
jgi:hypothetical protein